MKRLLILCLLAMISVKSNAGDGDKHLTFAGGWQANAIQVRAPLINYMIGYEFEGQFHNSFELYLDLASPYLQNKKENKENIYFNNLSFGLGVAYKPSISKSKNSQLRWRFGADIGSNGRSFQSSVEVGLEFRHTFSNDIQVFLLQKNDIVFWNQDHFRNGLLLGIKLPLNR